MQSRARTIRSLQNSIPFFLVLTALTALLSSIAYAQEEQDSGLNHLSEKSRQSIEHLVVFPGQGEAGQELAGTYEADGLGISGGMAVGSRLGSPTTQVGAVTVSTSIPQLVIPGAVLGSIYGETKRRIQEFRDALTEDLASSSSQSVGNTRLALQVFQDLNKHKEPRSRLFAATTPVPEDVDTLLFVSIRDVVIDVRKSDAILKTTAELSLHRKSDNEKIYQKWVYYQDEDSLSNWTRDDNALWDNYSNFAMHFLGREVAAAVLSRVDVDHSTVPAKSPSVKLQRNNPWDAKSRSTTPTLSWHYETKAYNPDYPWLAELDESDVGFDLEIYDTNRLVYARHGIQDPSFKLDMELDPCQTYRWTVRPTYRFDNKQRFGAWMRKPDDGQVNPPNAVIGTKASSAPAYIQDFATLKINCRAKAG